MSSEPEQIRANIEQTQRELSADVDALTDKLSPQRVVGRSVQRTRAGMSSMKDRVMGTSSNVQGTMSSTASSAMDTAGSAASSVAGAASAAPGAALRQTQGNPLAAGLIAFGAGWLLASLLPASEPEQQIASQVKDVATEKGQPIAQDISHAAREAAGELRHSAESRVQAVKDTATDAASTVKDEATSAAGDVGDRAKEARSRVTGQVGPDVS
jgi:ElaB/YqjD/DUF883 family membrane-anchored ribosome-binding protein